MEFEEAVTAAAHAADRAVRAAMLDYQSGFHQQEDAITGVMLGRIVSGIEALDTPGFRWTASILTNKGAGAEEKTFGADILIHVQMNTPTDNYSKGVLVQVKRLEPGKKLALADHQDLVEQCDRMLGHSSAAFVFDYARRGMRCGSAARVRGSSRRDLYDICNWTPFRFFLELFRCPIGDPKFTSAKASDIPIRSVLKIAAVNEVPILHRP